MYYDTLSYEVKERLNYAVKCSRVSVKDMGEIEYLVECSKDYTIDELACMANALYRCGNFENNKLALCKSNILRIIIEYREAYKQKVKKNYNDNVYIDPSILEEAKRWIKEQESLMSGYLDSKSLKEISMNLKLTKNKEHYKRVYRKEFI